MKRSSLAFAALEFEGNKAHCSGLGSSPRAAVKDALKVSDVQSSLHAVPCTRDAARSVGDKGGCVDTNKDIVLVMMTRAELRSLQAHHKVLHLLLTV